MSAVGSNDHGSPVKMYWVFCFVLCFMTFLEWLIFKKKDEWGLTGAVMVPSLLGMSLVKFVMVVGWYMHLRYDHNWVKYIFTASLIMGAGTGIALCILM